MKRTLVVVLLALAPASAYAQASATATADDLPLRRITMYRSGVSSVQRGGLVDGNATVQLRFSTDQINDILKSMVVMDLSKGQGRIDGVSYASREPLARRLAAFGVDLSDEPPLGTLLARLRGSKVVFTLPEGRIAGTILGGEMRPQAVGNAMETIQVPFVNVVTAEGIRSVNLTVINGVELADKDLNAELMKALAAVAEHRADRTKTVDINLTGEGAREIVVAYVQEAPVWKTSYRLVLPKAPQAEAGKTPPDRFTVQGWAIVENTTDEDWRDVTLALVSGRPVSFQMDLYEPLFLSRPSVPVPTVPGVLPRTYAGGQSPFRDDQAAAEADAGGRYAERKALNAPARPAGAPMPSEPMAPASGAVRVRGSMVMDADTMSGYAATAAARAVEAGEVFQFELDHPVTVERQRSAMLPIINTGIDGRRVSIFNPSDGSEHPMRGLEITNSTGLQLLPGPISVFDDGVYAGDAQIGHVPKGDKRLLAYAVDLDIAHTRDDKQSSEVRRVRIVKGLLEFQNKSVSETTFKFTNKDQARARTIVIEYPKAQGWELAPGLKPAEVTQDLYRFEVRAEPGKAAEAKIAQERVEHQSYQLTQFDWNMLLSYSKSGKVSDNVVKAFQEAAKRQAAISAAQRAINDLDRERAEIDADQARIRQNMNNATIDRQSDLYARYIKKLGEQETRLEAIKDATGKARADLARAEAALAEYLADLNIE